MLKKSKNKGITLIALVITIIVLLILAGISISMLSGDNSILRRATQAKETSNEAEIRERIHLAQISAMVNTNVKLDYEEFKKALKLELGIEGTDWTITPESSDPWIVTVNGKEYNIDSLKIASSSKDKEKITVLSAADISESEHYNSYVGCDITGYEFSDDTVTTIKNIEWQLFYAGKLDPSSTTEKEKIYLISKNYLPVYLLPAKNGTTPVPTSGTYKSGFSNYNSTSKSYTRRCITKIFWIIINRRGL